MIPRKLTKAELKELYGGSDNMEITKVCKECQCEFRIKVKAVDYDSWKRKKIPVEKAFPYLITSEMNVMKYGRCINCKRISEERKLEMNNSLFG